MKDELGIFLTQIESPRPDVTTGLLRGLSITIKDNLVTKALKTTAGSRMLADWIPPYDATAVARIKAAGATILGKTNCDAWGHGSSTENSDFGPTKNPWDPTRVPGGSSGGAAAAVAAGIGEAALGTDTGGSIRQPAAMCGVTGLKPTYGRVSRYGLIAMGSSLDCIGPIARDSQTVARVLEVIAGHDPLDATSVPDKIFRAERVTEASRNSDRPLEGLKVGLPKEYFADGLNMEVRDRVEAAIQHFTTLGATVIDVTLPTTPYALATYYIIMPAEVSSNLGRYDGLRYGHSEVKSQKSKVKTFNQAELVTRNRSEGLGEEAKRRIILGTFVLSAGYVDAYYRKALKARTLIRQDFDRVFDEVDMLATPTVPNPAFKFGEKTTDPLAMYLEDVYTVPASLAGLPALSFPCGFTNAPSLPVGLQLVGPMWSEEVLLRTAHRYQETTEWHTKKPPTFEPKSQKPKVKSSS